MIAMGSVVLDSAVHRIGWALLHFLWQGFAIAAVLAWAMWQLRSRSASLRYAVACGAMLLMLCLMGVTMWLAPNATFPQAGPALQARSGQVYSLAQADLKTNTPPSAGGFADAVQTFKERLVELVSPLLPWVVCVWLAGVAAFSLRHLFWSISLRKFRLEDNNRGDMGYEQTVAMLCRRFGINRVVEVMQSAVVRVPSVVGWIKPVVLMPVQALTNLPSEQLEVILAHELAHIRRHDYLINRIQVVVETLLFYHPAVWWVSRCIRIEREYCCDDLAVTVQSEPLVYAEALTAVAKLSLLPPQLAVAATGGSLTDRIHRMVGLSGGQARHLNGWLVGPFALMSILAIAMVIGGNSSADKAQPAELTIVGQASESEHFYFLTQADIDSGMIAINLETGKLLSSNTDDDDRAAEDTPTNFRRYGVGLSGRGQYWLYVPSSAGRVIPHISLTNCIAASDDSGITNKKSTPVMEIHFN